MAVLLAVLSACASYDAQRGIDQANADTREFSEGQLQLAQTQQDREQRRTLSQQLLAAPLGQQEAVRLLLANSPAFQAMMAQNWADAANAAQSGRIANPQFSFERVVTGTDAELTRFITFGLLDVLTLAQRAAMAGDRLEQARVRFAIEIVDRVTQVRQAWVKAVAAEQSLDYARQVVDSAQASAELARRMEAVGNFNRITRARHQAFYADVSTQWVVARQEALSRREELVRLLGLDESQAQILKLPPRLPTRPAAPMSPEDAGRLATRERLDVQLAKATLNASAKAQGLVGVTSMTDIELTARRGVVDSADAGRSVGRGYDIGIRLPILDDGGLRRDAMNAQTLAAANQLEETIRAAGSSLRESYAAYRSAYDISQHYQEEVLPLRKTIADESMLRYNAMIIGVFELLADARDQVATVIAAISAEQQFWLADAALKASLMGRPTVPGVYVMSGPSASGSPGH